MNRFLLLTLAGSMLLTGCQRSYGREDAAVAKNYPHQREATCPSWLVSHKTGQRYCASPKVDLTYEMISKPQAPAADRTADIDVNDKAQMMALGEEVYGEVCAACHQANGEGVAGTFPPLKGAGSYYGDAQNHAKIIVNGLNGEIVVNGVTYNGAMPPQGGMLNDIEIAAVATYERNSWGNADGDVTPEDVAAIR
ncbi:MAG: cytochrome c [Deltaproteobacteria bacterium]|nr:MAG: cytochrome c [Deltaproteobacteria bacterium]